MNLEAKVEKRQPLVELNNSQLLNHNDVEDESVILLYKNSQCFLEDSDFEDDEMFLLSSKEKIYPCDSSNEENETPRLLPLRRLHLNGSNLNLHMKWKDAIDPSPTMISCPSQDLNKDESVSSIEASEILSNPPPAVESNLELKDKIVQTEGLSNSRPKLVLKKFAYCPTWLKSSANKKIVDPEVSKHGQGDTVSIPLDNEIIERNQSSKESMKLLCSKRPKPEIKSEDMKVLWTNKAYGSASRNTSTTDCFSLFYKGDNPNQVQSVGSLFSKENGGIFSNKTNSPKTNFEETSSIHSSECEFDSQNSSSSYDESTFGKAEIFRPKLTQSERKMLGIATVPQGIFSDEIEDIKEIERRKELESRNLLLSQTETSSETTDTNSEPDGWDWDFGSEHFEIIRKGKSLKGNGNRKGLTINFDRPPELPWKDKLDFTSNMKRSHGKPDPPAKIFQYTKFAYKNFKSVKLSHVLGESKINNPEPVLKPNGIQNLQGDLHFQGERGDETYLDSSSLRSYHSVENSVDSDVLDASDLSSYLRSVLPDAKNKEELKKRRNMIIKTLKWRKIHDSDAQTSVGNYEEKITAVKTEYRQLIDGMEVKDLKKKLVDYALAFDEAITNLEDKKTKKLQAKPNDQKKIEKKFSKEVNSVKKDFLKKRIKVEKKIQKFEEVSMSTNWRCD